MAITETAVRNALRPIIDPELGIDIVDLGLVYAIEIDGAGVRVVMTMTSPARPLGDYLKDLVDSMVKWRVREAGRSIAVASRPVTLVRPEQPERPAMARVSARL